MTLAAHLTSEPFDTAKRQQILDGARRCFLEHGFDAASMNDIVKSAGVSKGTVYAYFPSKERLFQALVSEDKRRQAEQAIIIENPARAIEEVLFDLGIRLVRLTTADEAIAYSRMVLGVAAKFPEIGRSFFEGGAIYGITKIAGFLKTKMDDGTLRQADATFAAQQFMDLCLTGIMKTKLFACEPILPPVAPEVAVKEAVSMFLAAMRKA